MRNKIIRIGILLSAIILFGLTLSSVAHAAPAPGGFAPLADIPAGSKLSDLYSGPEGDLSTFINRIFSFAIAIGAMLAILRIAYAGYLYMVSDLWTNKERAKEILRDTTLGLLLLLAVWLILNQINPQFTNLNIKLKDSGSVQSERSTNAQTFRASADDRVTPTVNVPDNTPSSPAQTEGTFYPQAPYHEWCYQINEGFQCFGNNSSSGNACRNATQGIVPELISGCELLIR
ncbi:MAG: hypothetical protein UY39_C0004G0011 [Candidatus Kaiserbacteria bacterium GW2011_GWC2_49_12]|nr:MAG: hypothetical protein UY39_C0004G0011 [Candidatus Kaiserbacteria bacterium GW2011_GWC2_49_12]KKW18609.1 MAG: hypothetical protein UY59_C0002G0004 [Candidatus Kaiserbacteria bacterium GW2011_GWA1_50_28]